MIVDLHDLPDTEEAAMILQLSSQVQQYNDDPDVEMSEDEIPY